MSAKVVTLKNGVPANWTRAAATSTALAPRGPLLEGGCGEEDRADEVGGHDPLREVGGASGEAAAKQAEPTMKRMPMRRASPLLRPQ